MGRVALGAGQADISPTRSSSFPTRVKDVLTLLGKSKPRSKAVLHATFERQNYQGHASGEAHSHGVGDDRRDFTNRVCPGAHCSIRVEITRLVYLLATCVRRNARMRLAMRSPSSSRAKWPVSSRWNSRVFKSRL
jgi:hypothetical protein